MICLTWLCRIHIAILPYFSFSNIWRTIYDFALVNLNSVSYVHRTREVIKCIYLSSYFIFFVYNLYSFDFMYAYFNFFYYVIKFTSYLQQVGLVWLLSWYSSFLKKLTTTLQPNYCRTSHNNNNNNIILVQQVHILKYLTIK